MERTQSLPELDERLSCIADQVPACSLAADIGADHGKLSLWLLATGRCEKMIVSDISPVSRGKARDLFIRHHVLDRVILSGENGLHALSGKPEAVIITGMGGGVISEILSQDVFLHGAKLVLSAHTQLPLMRDAVIGREYCILSEHVVQSRGRYYLVISAVPGTQRLTETERLLGCSLTGTVSATVREYLAWQMSVAVDWRGKNGERQRRLIQERMQDEESKRSGGV